MRASSSSQNLSFASSGLVMVGARHFSYLWMESLVSLVGHWDPREFWWACGRDGIYGRTHTCFSEFLVTPSTPAKSVAAAAFFQLAFVCKTSLTECRVPQCLCCSVRAPSPLGQLFSPVSLRCPLMCGHSTRRDSVPLFLVLVSFFLFFDRIRSHFRAKWRISFLVTRFFISAGSWFGDIPVHVLLSVVSWYPSLQEHLYPPRVLLQIFWQSWPVLHSSMS